MGDPQIINDVVEVFVLLFHLLVVRAALISRPAPQEVSHRLKNFIHPPHVLVLEVAVVDLQEPVVFPFLLEIPVAGFPAWFGRLPSPDFLLGACGLGFFGPLLLQFSIKPLSSVLHGRLDLVFLVLLHENAREGVDSIWQLHQVFQLIQIEWEIDYNFRGAFLQSSQFARSRQLHSNLPRLLSYDFLKTA